MQVIARDLGYKIDKSEAFKGEDGKYYSSEEAWLKQKVKAALRQEDLHQRKIRTKCIEKMFDFMQYKSTDRMPNVFFGRLKVWHDSWGYSYDVIYETMILVSQTIDRIRKTKDFQNDTHRLFYYMGVIQNGFNDGKRQFDLKQKQIAEAEQPVLTAPVIEDVGVSNRKGKIVKLFEGDEEWN